MTRLFSFKLLCSLVFMAQDLMVLFLDILATGFDSIFSFQGLVEINFEEALLSGSDLIILYSCRYNLSNI